MPQGSPTDAGAGKRWRFRRDVVIYVAYANGVPQRTLADVFDLPQSRISAIVRAVRERVGPSAGRAPHDPTD